MPKIVPDQQIIEALTKALEELYVRYHSALGLLELNKVADARRTLDMVANSEASIPVREEIRKALADCLQKADAVETLLTNSPISKLIQ